MPRPKLSSLSSLLPAKGEATRPETIAQATEATLSAVSMQASEQSRRQAGEHDDMHTTQPASKRAAATEGSPQGHKDGPRSAVSFRMTEGLQERLRLYAFETRRSKQDILDDALHEYLVQTGH